jgi:hypothetical protein
MIVLSQLAILIVAGLIIYGISRATGGRLGVMQVIAILLGLMLLLGGAGVALCGGFVAIVPDQGMSGLRVLGLICLAAGAGILYAGVWIVRSTLRNARARQAAAESTVSPPPPEPPATSGN